MGLYAKRDIDMKSMIVEYIGEVIRSEVKSYLIVGICLQKDKENYTFDLRDVF